MLAILTVLATLQPGHAALPSNLDDALDDGLAVMTGMVTEMSCAGYMIDEYDNIHQTFHAKVQLEELQESDAVIVFDNEVVDLEWKRTRWADDTEPSCSSMLGELGQGWDGSVATYRSDSFWVADGQYMPEVLEPGAELPECGEDELAALQQEDPNPDEPEQPYSPDPGDSDTLDDADNDEKATSGSGCTHVSGGSWGGVALGLMIMGVLGRRRSSDRAPSPTPRDLRCWGPCTPSVAPKSAQS